MRLYLGIVITEPQDRIGRPVDASHRRAVELDFFHERAADSARIVQRWCRYLRHGYKWISARDKRDHPSSAPVPPPPPVVAIVASADADAIMMDAAAITVRMDLTLAILPVERCT